MKNIYDFFNFSWVNFFTQNSADIFKMKQNSQNFITTNILTCISSINTFDGYESLLQSSPLFIADDYIHNLF